jgi:hypothetical protein
VDERFPGDDGHGDTKGWDRASIANRSAKPYVPDISRADLTLPDEAGKLRSLVLCAICAFGMTILYFGIPFWTVGLFISYPGWFAAGVPILVLIVLTGVLYAVSVRETRELRALAPEL